MDQDRTITAHFVEADGVDLTLQATGNGTTNPEPGVYGYINGVQAGFSAQLLEGGDALTTGPEILKPGNHLKTCDHGKR